MWIFKELERGAPERDPHEGEFFHLTEPSEAIVREVIQNSLDAGKPGENAVRLCFTFGTVNIENVRNVYFKDLERHLRECNLLPPDYSDFGHIRFLTIEDFGTTGLDGDTGEKQRPQGRSNFYNFWWCEGKSKKSGREAGRWGLGKTTIHLSSKLRSFWGLTKRQDDSRVLLMGKALLKTHRIDNRVYDYYAYFAEKDFKPLADERPIQDLKEKFSISRKNEFGLSLVIPMPNDEITASSVTRSVILHYFYAIMQGILEVEIRESNCDINLNSQNLINIASSQCWEGTSWEETNVLELLQFINNVRHNTDIIELRQTNKPEITEESFGDKVGLVKNAFTSGNLVAFKIPVTIKKVKEPQPVLTHFEVYLKRYPEMKQSEEFYIRSGITIPDIKVMGTHPVRGLLVAEESTINEFLGDCETPAHTDWNERIEEFKNKYEYSTRTLRFIKKNMSKIVSIIDQPPKEQQKDFLKEIFFTAESSPQENKQTTTGSDIPPISKKPPPFNVTKIDKGFRVSLDRLDIPRPIKVIITVAYDVRRGNPFTNYDLADFDLKSRSVSIKRKGCKILNANRNVIEVQAKGNFELAVKGFDPNRDLIIDVREKKNETAV